MKALSVKCAVCGKEFDTERQLHGHLKAHKLRMAEYYQKYFPRKDKYSGELIKFKSKDYYFDRDFNSRDNLRLWLKNQDENEIVVGNVDSTTNTPTNPNIHLLV